MGEGFPLWSMASMAWEGREPLRDWICLSLFLRSQILPFHRFLYSRRSVTLIWLKFLHHLYPEFSFLAAKEGHQSPYGVSMRVRGAPASPGRAPYLVGPSSIVSHGFFFPKIIYIPKKISVSFYPIWNPFDMDFLQNKKTCNKQELALGTGSIC